MTLDEAIKYEEETAYNLEQEAECIRSWGKENDTKQGAINCEKCAEKHRQLAEWLKELKQLREQTRWIPVSERLPEDEDYVLVCYADGSIRTAYYYIDTESYPPEFRDCCETGWYDYNENFIYQDVLAWMPLPEPYKSD